MDNLQVGENYIMHSPFTNDKTIVNFRGDAGDGRNVVVWTGRSQITIPKEWLIRKSSLELT